MYIGIFMKMCIHRDIIHILSIYVCIYIYIYIYTYHYTYMYIKYMCCLIYAHPEYFCQKHLSRRAKLEVLERLDINISLYVYKYVYIYIYIYMHIYI